METKLNPRDGKEALRKKMDAAGEDLRALLTWVDTQPAALPQRDSLRLLRRVFAENFEVVEGAGRQTRAQPTGAVHNPHEPEAQWSSKSTTRDKTWVGYKAQIAETVAEQTRQKAEPTQSFLTALVTQEAPASDKPGMTHVLEEQAPMGLAAPSELYVDGAYVSAPALHQAQAQGRELVGPAPASPDRGHGFTADRFDVQVEARRAVCPASQINNPCSRLEEEKTGQVSYRFEWNQATCRHGPLRQECLAKNQTHRTLAVGEHHSLLQARRRQMETPEFQLAMRRRNAIEGTPSELVRGYLPVPGTADRRFTSRPLSWPGQSPSPELFHRRGLQPAPPLSPSALGNRARITHPGLDCRPRHRLKGAGHLLRSKQTGFRIAGGPFREKIPAAHVIAR